jgi:protocatechuate 3,4-dioxygenase alpha subunit
MTEPLGLTPSQTVGPFLHIALEWADGPFVVPEGTPGAFWLTGTVRDGAGALVTDALVETWQADPEGRFAPDSTIPGFRGFGRSTTDGDGRYRILTVRPGPVSAQAPHLDVSVFARGLLDRLVTRIYLPGEEANTTDPVLSTVPAARRPTLIATPDGADLRFDIHLQGDAETVFFVV